MRPQLPPPQERRKWSEAARENLKRGRVPTPNAPLLLGGKRGQLAVLLGTSPRGRRNLLEPHRDVLKTLWSSEASAPGNPEVQGPALSSRPRGHEVPGVGPHGKKAFWSLGFKSWPCCVLARWSGAAASLLWAPFSTRVPTSKVCGENSVWCRMHSAKCKAWCALGV